MIRWCAYCQRFMGERPPYCDYGLTHGVCDKCLPLFESDSDHGFERIMELKRFHDALREAGEHEDLELAMALIEKARGLGVRPSDLLVGLIAPILYEVGSMWEDRRIGVADEHRFTRFYEAVVKRVTEEARSVVPFRPRGAPHENESALDVMLIQPRSNKHVLGLKVLEHWLWDHGVSAMVVSLAHPVSLEDLVRRLRPRWIGISVSLPEQMDEVAKLIELVTRENPRLGILLGGQAIKSGLVQAPTPAIAEPDPNGLLALIRGKHEASRLEAQLEPGPGTAALGGTDDGE